MKPGARYYAGGVRVVIDGVPMRLPRKPSAHNLAWMRADEREKTRDYASYYTRKDIAEMRVRDADKAIENYAEALGISESEARKRIAAQWTHMLANPLRDLSLEYDL